MTKSLRILALLGLLICLSRGQQHILTGYNYWNTFTDNNTQCNVVVNGELIPQSQTDPTLRYQLHQSFRLGNNQPPMAPPAGCNYQSYYPDSFFYGDTFDQYTTFLIRQNDSNSDYIVDSTLYPAAIQQTNGSTCVSLPQSDQPNLQQYVCKTIFDTTPIDIAVFGTGNLTFQSPSALNGLTFVDDVLSSRVISLQANTITRNTSFPNIVANLYDACGSTGTVISTLTTGITVTTSVDLTANLGGMWLAWTLVRKNGTKDYLSVPSNSSTPLFTAGSGNNGCWWLGINYGDVLPSLDYCAQGCSVSFVFTDSRSRLYTLKTYGLTTATSTGSGNGSGSGNGTDTGNGTGNGTGSGSGNGSGNGNGNGSGNGGNNGSASSALSMSFNAALLLVSFAYLMWM